MITVTGSLAFDHIMDFPGKFADHIMPDKIHQINLSFLVNTLNTYKGGTAGNISYTLALLKISVSILGVVGSNFSEYEQFLKNAGVDTSLIKLIPNKLCSTGFIMTDKSDNQITAYYPGAMSDASTLSVPETDLVVISPNDPNAMIKFAQECQQKKISYIFDPGMQLPRLTDEQLITGINGTEILIGNDYEMELIKKRVKDETLFKKIKIVITTLGEKGSIIESNGQMIEIKSAKPEIVLDPTGAGDAYRAGFLAGFLKNLNLKTCGQMGSIASCYAVEKYGTTNHTFTIEEFCKRYQENFGEELKFV